MPTRTSLGVSVLFGAALLVAASLTPSAAWANPTGAKAAKPPVVWDNADVARDGVIDWKDVVFVLRHMGERCTAKRRTVAGDLNRDCRVDGHDLSRVIHEVQNARKRPAPVPANAPPQPKADAASTREDTPVTVAVLTNDSDPNGDTLRVVSAGAGRAGTTSIRQDGNVTYTPARDACGADSFSYTVADTKGLTATQSVAVTITPVNDPPTVTASVSVSSGIAPLELVFTAAGTDADGDPLTYTWSFGDAQGAQGAQVGHTYADAGDFNATVTVSDGVASAQASLSVSVAPAPELARRPASYVVHTAAGTGNWGQNGVGGPATAAELTDPRQVALTADGTLYIAETRRLLRVDTAGTLSTVRTFSDSPAGDEGPSIAVGPDGSVYYTDADATGYCSEWGQYLAVRVRRLTPAAATDPVVATWLNTEGWGTCSPSLKLAVDGAGSFYLGSASSLTRLLPGSTGDASWTQSAPDYAYALAGDPAGGVFVGGYSSLVRVAPDGGAALFAGNTIHGSTGDGGPALDAQVGTVSSVTVCPDGTVTFLEFDRASFVPRIREVTPDGLIATIGGGTSGFNGDGLPAMSTAFSFAVSAGIACVPEGGFYVADRDNARVRLLLPVR